MALAGCLFLPGAASAQGVHVLGWGLNANIQASPVPTNVMNGVASIAAGYFHSLAVLNGRAWAWGFNGYGQTNVPAAALSDVIQVAGGGTFSLALKTGGEVIPWGSGVVSSNMPVAAQSGVSQIAGGEWHALALKDGGIIAWGSNSHGQCNVPADLSNGVSAISAGGFYSLALKNGGVQVFGIPATNEFSYGIRDVPSAATSGVSAISAGRWHALALKDGGVIAWGATNFFDATNYLPDAVTSGVSAISAGDLFSMALKTDGTIVVWGDSTKGQTPVPNFAATGVTHIAAGVGHCLVVSPVMPPRFMGAVLPVPYVDHPYAGSVTAAGDPAVRYYKFGTWPSWITLSETSGAIGGTPLTQHTNKNFFAVLASNSVGQVTNFYEVSVLVMPSGPPIFLTTSPLPDGVLGEPYSVQIVASNSTTFSLILSGGNPLPEGLALSTNGLLSGTPTEVYDKFIIIRATNEVGWSNRTFNLKINPPPSPPEFITESPLPSGVVGAPYSVQIVASNSPVFSLFAGDLPDGLSLGTNGLISGTPTHIENPTFTVRATNMVGASNRVYALEIFGPPEFVTESPLPNGVRDVSYSLQIEALGDPSFSVAEGALPGGMTLSTNGLLGGAPDATGFFNFTVHATNGYGWSNRVYDLEIGQVPAFVTTNPLPAGQVGVAYSQQIAADGDPAFSVVAGSLPGGLELSGSGLLSGTPEATGAFNFTVRATNDYGWSNRVYDLAIAALEPPAFTYIHYTNSEVRMSWTNPNPVGSVAVYFTPSITNLPVTWSNLGVHSSPWTNVAPTNPSYYQLRLSP